jgi:hypothetical protein
MFVQSTNLIGGASRKRTRNNAIGLGLEASLRLSLIVRNPTEGHARGEPWHRSVIVVVFSQLSMFCVNDRESSASRIEVKDVLRDPCG